MRIATVLRSGGVYTPAHVQALHRQLERWAPLYEHFCLSDVPVLGVSTMPLLHKWPGWWSKMELYAPCIKGDVLFMDLDTVVVGPIDDLLKRRDLTLLRDFYRTGLGLKTRLGYRPEGLGSGLMLLPENRRADIWSDFTSAPERHMAQHVRGGDQQLLEKHWLSSAARWQDVVPGQIVSWKVHCQHGVPQDARVVCFHGQPRPFDVSHFKDLY